MPSMPVAIAACPGPGLCVGGTALAVPRAGLARAPLAEQVERMEPGRVSVAPCRLDRVRADERHVHEPRLVRGQRGIGIQPARHACLAAAVGARAQPAKPRAVVPGLVAVGPGDGDGARSAVRVDPHGGHALILHVSIVPRGPRRSSSPARPRPGPSPIGDTGPSPNGRSGPCRYARGRMSLVVDHLSKRFGAVVALDDLAFEVPPGQVFGFLGANGAGKTTTMRITLGVLEPDAGRVTWRGAATSSLPRSTFGYLPEERGLYPR